ncbi:MAG: phosphoribosyl-ATP diphosphatase [Planctomycetia bacterium]|nr:phosphoribosyl-ATP diphosphatase [Planctomycetia bacterium]
MRRLGETLEALERVVAERKAGPSARSYTSRLLAGGVPAIAAKVTEEAGELVAAADHEADERVVAEAADLVYHLLVLLACRDVGLAAVETELARRFGISGLDEKAARPPKGSPPASASAASDPHPRTDGADA